LRLLIALIVWTVAVLGAIEVSSVVAGSIHTTTTDSSSPGTSSSSTSSPPSSSSSSVDPSSITATDRLSLFQTVNFAKALASVRQHVGANARLSNVVIYPGYLSISAIRRGSAVEVYVAATGRTDVTTTAASPSGQPTLPLSAIGVRAPAALAHRIATDGHVPTAQLNYMVLERDLDRHGIRWLIYPRQGGRVEYFETRGASAPLFEYRTSSPSGLQPVKG
jgi:hypothetical protein